MQNKYKLPDDVRYMCIGIVKGHRRRQHELKSMRNEVIEMHGQTNSFDENGRACVSNYIIAGVSTTEMRGLTLQNLSQQADSKLISAVEQALTDATSEIDSLELQNKLKNALVDSCENRRRSYNYFDLPGISRKKFFEYKNKFLYSIANRALCSDK